MEQQLQLRLAERRQRSLYRQRRELASPQGARLHLDGRELLQFCSNDYLGHAAHPKLVEAMRDAAERYGVGGGASHLVCGHSELHHRLEQRLAAFTGRDRALLFSTGYMANLGVIAGLLGRGDHLLEDRLNHASLLDGGLLCGAKMQRFAHSDSGDLQRRLQQLPATGQRLVAVDAVYSMDGDIAPLGDIARIAADNSAWLMADDAHGFGVLGERGAGTAELLGLGQAELPVLMATLGKALGSFGAFVAGSETLIESLIQFARPYIYTTAMPPAVAAATLASLDLLDEEPWRRQRLAEHIALFRREAVALGLPLLGSATAIQPLMIGDDALALRVSAELEGRGLLISAIRPPTVPLGTARLRITLSAAHRRCDIEQLLATLDEVCRQLAPQLLEGGR